MTALAAALLLVGPAAALGVVLFAPRSRLEPVQRLYRAVPGGPHRGAAAPMIGSRPPERVGQAPSRTVVVHVGRSLALLVIVGIVHVGLACLVGFALWSRSILRRRRVARRAQIALQAGLADVIDLFAIALVSGQNVTEAVRQVGAWAEGDFARAFQWCELQVAAGRSLSDALEVLPERLGPASRPLIAALVATHRHGAPITASLAQLAVDTRADRRRHAEAVARKLPVALLFPLVACVLPAFLLVTVVPVIAETISNLELIASP